MVLEVGTAAGERCQREYLYYCPVTISPWRPVRPLEVVVAEFQFDGVAREVLELTVVADSRGLPIPI